MYDEMYLSIERRKSRNYNILDDTVKIDVNSLYIEKNVALRITNHRKYHRKIAYSNKKCQLDNLRIEMKRS